MKTETEEQTNKTKARKTKHNFECWIMEQNTIFLLSYTLDLHSISTIFWPSCGHYGSDRSFTQRISLARRSAYTSLSTTSWCEFLNRNFFSLTFILNGAALYPPPLPAPLYIHTSPTSVTYNHLLIIIKSPLHQICANRFVPIQTPTSKFHTKHKPKRKRPVSGPYRNTSPRLAYTPKS